MIQIEKDKYIKKIILSAENQGKKVGELIAYDYRNHLSIPIIFVEPEFAGKGFGTRLLYELSKRFKKPVVVMFPVESAVSFYKKRGFRRIPKSFAVLKHLSKSERRLVGRLRKEYSKYLEISRSNIMFASPGMLYRKTRKYIKRR